MPNTAPTPTTPPIDATDPANQPVVEDVDPTSDTTGTQDEPSTREVGIDFARLNAAGDDAAVWGDELARFLADLTGKHVDPGSLATLFGAYGLQVQNTAYRSAALAAANYPIATSNTPTDPIVAAMDIRGDIAELLLQTAR